MKTFKMPNECERLFEALSAWIDGEATREEAREVQAHLEGCPDCREVRDALCSLAGSAPTVPMPELPAGFAARTRKLVEERTERAWDVRARKLADRLAGWLDRLIPAPQGLAKGPLLALQGAAGVLDQAAGTGNGAGQADAVSALLATRAQRSGARPPSFWFFLALTTYGLPAAILALMDEKSLAVGFLVWVGMGLLVALPWYHFRTDLAVLVSLRRGRCLEEILGSGLEPFRIVDTLARFGLRSLFRVGLPVALVLLAGAPMTRHLLGSWWAPLRDPLQAAMLVPVWLVLVGVLFSVGSYAAQAMVLFSRGGERSGPATLAVALALFVPAASLVGSGIGAALDGEGPGLVPALGCTLAGALLWVGWLGRRLSIWGMEHPDALERWNRSSAPRRNAWVRPWNDNPIVAREVTRLSAAIPLGVLGLVLVRAFPAAVQAQGLWFLMLLPEESRSLAFWVAAAGIGWYAWLRASSRTSAALAQESEGQTLEPMIQSGLTRQDFVSGWLQVACAPLYLELALTGGLVLMVPLSFPEVVSGEAHGIPGTLDLGSALLALLALTAMPMAGAWSGLAVSALSANRREAWGRNIGAAFSSLLVWVVAWGLSTTLLTVLTLVLGLEFEPSVWVALSGSVLPAGALGLTVLGLSLRARTRAENHLRTRWEGADPEPVSSPSWRGGRRRALILGPAALAGVLALGRFLVVLALPAADLTMAGSSPAVWLFSSVVGALALAVVGWWVLRPTLIALTDHLGRSVFLSAALAGCFGAVAGFLLVDLPLMVRLLVEFGLVEQVGGSVSWGEVWTWGIVLGFVLAAILAGLGLRNLPAEEPECLTFRERLHQVGAVPLCVSLIFLALWLVVGGYLGWRTSEFPEQDLVQAREILARAVEREHRRDAVSSERNGFSLLEPVLMRRALERRQVGLSQRHQELLEGFQAFSWVQAGDPQESLEALRANPDLARQSATRLDAVLPVLIQALARPEFVVPIRWSEGPNGAVPDFILMRTIARGLATRARMLEEEGDLAGALELHLLNLRWSDRLAGYGPLITAMITHSLTSTAEESVLGFVERNRLAEADLRRVLRAVEEGRSTPQAFLDSLDDEFSYAMRVFDGVRAGRIEELNEDWKAMLVLPGSYWERERQLYIQAFLPGRQSAVSGAQGAVVVQEPPALSLASTLVPFFERANYQACLAFSRHLALRAVCLLELHRLRAGSYPATLAEIWTPLPDWGEAQDPLSGGDFLYRRTDRGFELRSSVSLKLRRFAKEDERSEGPRWFPASGL